MNGIANIATLIRAGAISMSRQHKYSNGYLSQGDSEIAEENIVIHVASSFITNNHVVWAQSPFKSHENNKCKHLDLLVDLDSGNSEHSTVLAIEGKRIAPGEENRKLGEIINDFDRIKSWPALPLRGVPTFFAAAQEIEWFYGAIVVVIPESCNELGEIPDQSFSAWWAHLKGVPPGYSGKLLNRLRAILESAAEKGGVLGEYWDGGRRLVTLYAIFDFGSGTTEDDILTARHEAAHAVVAWRLGVPIRRLSMLAPGGRQFLQWSHDL